MLKPFTPRGFDRAAPVPSTCATRIHVENVRGVRECTRCRELGGLRNLPHCLNGGREGHGLATDVDEGTKAPGKRDIPYITSELK